MNPLSRRTADKTQMMRPSYWLLAFVIVLSVELFGVWSNNEVLQFIFKPLLMPLLAAYFNSAVWQQKDGLRKWVLFALFFSWVGDVLLMFQQERSLFFLLGLSAFLIAHLFYIIFFHRIRAREKVKGNLWLLLIVAVYYIALISLLSSSLGEMKLPVRVYGIVISFMFLLAMHTLFIQNKTAGRWMIVGALLFILSDSALALNKFYRPFEAAGVVVMLTYGLGQLFIIEGAGRYINSLVRDNFAQGKNL
jgi:uncharacterized membrane protein YhhN